MMAELLSTQITALAIATFKKLFFIIKIVETTKIYFQVFSKLNEYKVLIENNNGSMGI
jgi:hypothetical protein